MAGRRIADEEEKIARWRRLGDLGMEEALRESGASSSAITAALDLIESAGRQIDNKKLNAIAECLRLEGAKCLLLAVLGRAASSIEFLDLKRHRPEDALNGDEAISLCVNLASNSNVQILDLRLQVEFAKPGRCILLANALTTNTALVQLRLSQIIMPPEAVKFLMEGVKQTSSLESLDLGGNPLSDDGISYVAKMLTGNTTIKVLSLSETSCGYEGAKYITAALERNMSLESFHFAGNPIGRAGMTMLLTPFIHDELEDGDPPRQTNTTITLLDLDVYSSEVTSRDHFAVEPVASMIRTNKTLTELWLRGAPFRTQDWLDQIIPALTENTTLKSLQVKRCKGLNSEGAVQALMDLVQFSNTGLEEINVADTAMDSKQGVINEELRINKEYRGRLRHQAKVKPKSCRLVFCGYEFAGKTSICETMGRIEHGTPGSHRWKMGWKKFLKKRPSLRKFLYGANAYKEMQERTRGFDIVILGEELPRTSIWDFAGQREYYALHDYMFPNVKNSCFLYVCSTRFPPNDQNQGEGEIKDRNSMEQEFLFWMRFIASNSKLVKDVEGQNGRTRLPSVTFVLSKKDTLNANQQSRAKQWAEDIVSDLKLKFEEVIALSEPVDIVDAYSFEDVKRLLTTVGKQLTEILDQPTEYVICGEVCLALENWATENPSKPILSSEEFTTICKKVRRVVPREYIAAELDTDTGRETVLAYLNDIGKIIFSKRLDFIVVDPRWFGSGVLGSLINAFGGSQEGWKGICTSCLRSSRRDVLQPVHDQGFVRRNRINDILEKSLLTMSLTQAIPSDNLIKLMIELEMCFIEQPVGDVEPRLFIPALFDDEFDDNAARGLRQLHWTLAGSLDEQVHYIYVGRRLECQNKYLTFLTPGFFPRLQVVIQNFLHKQHWTENIGFKVARNFISFTHNGKEVLLEYSGDIDYFVDILVKSSNSFDETLEFIEEHVVTKIREFCASPQGCQGVQLAEAVIRPVCVEELHLCANRKAHAVSVSTLKTQVEHHGSSYKHHWCRHIEGVSDVDVALTLLEGESAGSTTSLASSSYIPQDIPTHYYPTIDDRNFFRKLEANISLAKAMPIKLHLMCVGKHSPHKVDGQPGRTMKVGDKTFPMMRFALSLLVAGLSIGGASAGVPLDILPIDRWIQELFSTPHMPIAVDKLAQMMDHDRSPGPLSDQKVLKLLGRYLEIDPSSEWLKKFLKLEDSEKFRNDFRLWKVIYNDTSEVGWLCWDHFDRGITNGTVKSVPH